MKGDCFESIDELAASGTSVDTWNTHAVKEHPFPILLDLRIDRDKCHLVEQSLLCQHLMLDILH